MLCKIGFISHGKHENLHINLKIGGSRKNPLFTIKLMVFFDTGNAYIMHNTLHKDYLNIIDFTILTKVIQDELSKHDYYLVMLGKDFLRKRFTTEQILKLIEND